MNSNGEHQSDDGEIEELLSRLCDGTLAAEELQRLGEKIATDAAARRLYLQYLDLHAVLSGSDMTAALPDLSRGETPFAGRLRRVRRWLPWSAAAAILLTTATLYWLAVPRSRTQQQAFVRVVEVMGQTELWDADGQSIRATAGATLWPGTTVRTYSEDAYVALEFAGGSRIELNPEGQLRFTDAEGPANGPRLLLSTGVLYANVKARPAGRPLTVLTPQAEVSVEGTEFFVSATLPDTTEVETESGSVRLTRLADGRSIEVPAGSSASASSSLDPMEVRPLPDFAAWPRASLQAAGPWGLAFSSDATRLLALNQEGWTEWDVVSGQRVSPLHDLGRDLRNALLSGDGRIVAVNHRNGCVRLLDAATGRETHVLRIDEVKHKHWTLALSHDGTRLAVGRAVSGPRVPIRLWNTAEGSELPSIAAPDPVRGLALSANGKRMATATPPRRKRPNPPLLVWDVDSRTRLAAINTPERPLPILLFAPDGQRLAAATDRGEIYLWDIKSGKILIRRDIADGWTRPVKSLAFAPDGRLLAAGMADGRVRVCDTRTDSDVGLLDAGKRHVQALAFSPDGRTLAVSTVRGPVTLWDVPERQ